MVSIISAISFMNCINYKDYYYDFYSQSGSHMTKVTRSSVALSDKAKYRQIRL